MIFLDLSYNSLTGAIPETYVDVLNLERVAFLALLAQFQMHSGHNHHNDTIPSGFPNFLQFSSFLKKIYVRPLGDLNPFLDPRSRHQDS